MTMSKSITFAKSSPSGDERHITIEIHILVRQANGQHVRLVGGDRSRQFQEGQIILLRLVIELRMLVHLHSALNPFILGAGEIDASHPHQKAIRLDTVTNQTKG